MSSTSRSRVRSRVAAVAAPPAVIGDDAEAILEGLGQRRVRRPVVERANHQDDRRSLSHPIERDGGSVFRAYLVHGLSTILCPPGHYGTISAYASRPETQLASSHRTGQGKPPKTGPRSSVGGALSGSGLSHRQLRRTPSRRSSQKTPSAHFGAQEPPRSRKGSSWRQTPPYAMLPLGWNGEDPRGVAKRRNRRSESRGVGGILGR